VLLAIAALTSTISLLEVVTAYFVDEVGWRREKAVWIIGGGCLVLAVPSALSAGASDFFTSLPGGGFLDLQNIIWGNFSLSIGALLLCVFVGWRWGIPNALKEMRASGHTPPLTGLWGFLVRFACPIAVLIVLGFILYTGEYF
jgi:NSS family neurotransmitter:Na+ symporter